MSPRHSNVDRAMYVISVAAELAGVHPQTLRVYERKGLLAPSRTRGNTRRYSERDIELLKRIQELTHEGINLAGVMKVLELEEELDELKAKHRAALEELDHVQAQVAEAVESRAVFPLVLLKDVKRIRRAMKTDVIDRAARRRVFPAPAAAKPPAGPETEQDNRGDPWI